MSRSSKFVLLLLAGVVVLSAGAIAVRRVHTAQGGTAMLYQDGLLIKEIELDKVGVAFSFEVVDKDGHENTVSVERGRICISQADCPDRICVKQGWITDGVTPLVCLPHGLVIEIVGGGQTYDAAAG